MGWGLQAASLWGAGQQTEFVFRGLEQQFLSSFLCPRPKRVMSQKAATRQPLPWGFPGKGTDEWPGPNTIREAISSSSRVASSFRQPLVWASRCSLQPHCTRDFSLMVVPCVRGAFVGTPRNTPAKGCGMGTVTIAATACAQGCGCTRCSR